MLVNSERDRPANGGNADVMSPNSLPPGFSAGTTQGQRAAVVARWFATQGENAYAARNAVQPNG